MTNTDINAANATWNWGGKPVKLADTPLASIVVLLNRGATHIHGSEVSSAVMGDIVRERLNGQTFANADERKAADRAVRETLRAEAVTKSGDFVKRQSALREELLAEIMAGVIGESAERGPKLSPLEAEMHIEAKAKVKARLQSVGQTGMWGKNGTAYPKPDYEFALDNGSKRTWESLVSGYLAKFDAELRKSAQATLDRRAREAQKLAEQASKAGDVDF